MIKIRKKCLVGLVIEKNQLASQKKKNQQNIIVGRIGKRTVST